MSARTRNRSGASSFIIHLRTFSGALGFAQGSAWLTEICPPFAKLVSAAGVAWRSTTVTSWPCWRRKYADVTPSNPAPNTMTFTARTPSALDVEPEVDHVAFLHDVGLAFEPQLAGFFRAVLAAPRDVLVVADDLGANEAALEIGMDRAGGLRRRRVALRRPRSDFFGAGRIERLQAEQLVSRANHAVQAGLREP